MTHDTSPPSRMRRIQPGDRGIDPFRPYEWGYPVRRLYGSPELFDQVGQFRAAVRLIPADATPAPISLEAATMRNLLAGDSDFAVEPRDVAFGIDVAQDARIDVRCHLNDSGRIGGFEVLPFGAPSLYEANQMVNMMLERLVIRYAVACGIALRWDTVLTEDVSGVPRCITFRVGYPTVQLREPMGFGGSLGLVDHFGRQIVEALRNESPFYRCLCYFKVARYYYGAFDQEARRLRHEMNMPIGERRRVPDEEPFNVLARDAVGRTYADLVGGVFRETFRNAVAHLTTTEVLRPVDVNAEDSVAVASLVLKKMAFDAVDDCVRELTDLYAAGVDGGVVESIIAEIDARERRRR